MTELIMTGSLMAGSSVKGRSIKGLQRAIAMQLNNFLPTNSYRASSTWLVQLSVIVLMCVLAFPAHAERVRELASFAGVRDNQLVGYGLVVGLDSTGDQTTQAPFTSQSLTNMLSQLGVTVPAGTNLQLRNVAAVMVTADLPPFSRPGQRLDIVVSSIANARSLRGGTLLMTPLRGADGDTYAIEIGRAHV